MSISSIRFFLSFVGILYVWCLPFLADIGFAQKNSNSISEFISNPPATGAMAAISFMPLVLMWEYQDIIINHYKKNNNVKKILDYSINFFQFFYGMFLTCTYGFVPTWIHTMTVVLFGLSFIIHSILVLYYIQPSFIAQFVLLIGILAFFLLLFANDMWFWACECIGLTAMILFTPIDWYLNYDSQNILLN